MRNQFYNFAYFNPYVERASNLYKEENKRVGGRNPLGSCYLVPLGAFY